jgi:hypothetical protein
MIEALLMEMEDLKREHPLENEPVENEMGRVGSGLEPSLTRPRRARAECTLGPTCPLTRYLLIKPDPSGLKSLFFASNRRYPSLSAFTRTSTRARRPTGRNNHYHDPAYAG